MSRFSALDNIQADQLRAERDKWPALEIRGRRFVPPKERDYSRDSKYPDMKRQDTFGNSPLATIQARFGCKVWSYKGE